MGYRGKVAAQEQAREMRARNMTLQDIADALGVSKSSVSLWVSDVPFTPSTRRTGPQRRPHPFHEAKLAQITALNAEGIERIGTLSDAAFLAAGAALYAGEGTKRDGAVRFANSDPTMVRFFCAWLRSSRSTKLGFAFASTFTRASIWTRQRRAGQQSPEFPECSSGRHTGPSPTQASVGTSTSSGACTWTTPARGLIGRSWASCGHCYDLKPFRGSSIGSSA
jgi:hypothetical protein